MISENFIISNVRNVVIGGFPLATSGRGMHSGVEHPTGSIATLDDEITPAFAYSKPGLKMDCRPRMAEVTSRLVSAVGRRSGIVTEREHWWSCFLNGEAWMKTSAWPARRVAGAASLRPCSRNRSRLPPDHPVAAPDAQSCECKQSALTTWQGWLRA